MQKFIVNFNGEEHEFNSQEKTDQFLSDIEGINETRRKNGEEELLVSWRTI